jgi:hypothetical protein
LLVTVDFVVTVAIAVVVVVVVALFLGSIVDVLQSWLISIVPRVFGDESDGAPQHQQQHHHHHHHQHMAEVTDLIPPSALAAAAALVSNFDIPAGCKAAASFNKTNTNSSSASPSPSFRPLSTCKKSPSGSLTMEPPSNNKLASSPSCNDGVSLSSSPPNRKSHHHHRLKSSKSSSTLPASAPINIDRKSKHERSSKHSSSSTVRTNSSASPTTSSTLSRKSRTSFSADVDSLGKKSTTTTTTTTTTSGEDAYASDASSLPRLASKKPNFNLSIQIPNHASLPAINAPVPDASSPTSPTAKLAKVKQPSLRHMLHNSARAPSSTAYCYGSDSECLRPENTRPHSSTARAGFAMAEPDSPPSPLQNRSSRVISFDPTTDGGASPQRSPLLALRIPIQSAILSPLTPRSMATKRMIDDFVHSEAVEAAQCQPQRTASYIELRPVDKAQGDTENSVPPLPTVALSRSAPSVLFHSPTAGSVSIITTSNSGRVIETADAAHLHEFIQVCL